MTGGMNGLLVDGGFLRERTSYTVDTKATIHLDGKSNADWKLAEPQHFQM